MTYDVYWDSDRKLIFCTLKGRVDANDIEAVAREAKAEADSQDGDLDICCDATGITSLIVAPSDLPRLAATVHRLATRHPNGRTAFAVSRTLDQAIMELLVIKSSVMSRDRKTFDTVRDALAWVSCTPA